MEIVELFKRINAEGTTILLATHNQGVVEQMNGRVVHLQDGHVVTDTEVTS